MAAKRIAVECQLKSITRTMDNNKVSFKDLIFTGGQVEQLEIWLAERRRIRVTIDPTELLLTDEVDE